jgi:hypothetical protein
VGEYNGLMKMMIDDNDPVALWASVERKLSPLRAAAGGSAGSSAAGAPDNLQQLDAKAVGELLGVDAREVYRMARVEEIGCIRKGRAVWFTRAQVAEWQRKHSVAARR